MAGLLDSYTKNKSAEDKKEIERRVKEIGADNKFGYPSGGIPVKKG